MRRDLLALAVFVALGVVLLMLAAVLRIGSSRENLILRVTAGRGPAGFSFTNQENSELSNCNATIRDSAGTTWQATIPRRLARSASVSVEWAQFTHDDQRLPSAIGPSREISVSCLVVVDQVRRTAEIAR